MYKNQSIKYQPQVSQPVSDHNIEHAETDQTSRWRHSAQHCVVKFCCYIFLLAEKRVNISSKIYSVLNFCLIFCI